ncbi:uncharacterized protein At4g14450, chloroplastic-like [Lycium barbarum]|uniref:uncharacterized protein At4g14450, chloroplastic-like n=1 Tax=Lycium barbarum TaxID=112863 RepID=UPI00293EC78E|nr:uncharacterized protein At4g14450, chloroplastic-like [Lycium barbarum]
MSSNNRRNPNPNPNPSRLQRRAPASIQINRSTDWNVAIPLLSPLITSPEEGNLKSAINRISNSSNKKEEVLPEKPVMVFKKWQHPAAPFCHEQQTAPFIQFVCTGTGDRR